MRYTVGMMMFLSSITGLVLTMALSGGCVNLKAAAGSEAESVYEGDGAVYGAGAAYGGGGGTYEGAAWGYRGMIRVSVGLEQGAITEITVIESQEDHNVGGAAIDELTDLVLLYNTTELDAVSGATETSKGFLEAIENAIMGL